jgi:hypothetical protein
MSQLETQGIPLSEASSLHAPDQPKYIQSSVIELVDPQSPPPKPQPLAKSRLSEWVNNIYDAALCTAPLLLIMKVGLVFYAHHLDKFKSGIAKGAIQDAPSSYTTYLIRFNAQVNTIHIYEFLIALLIPV